MKFVSAWLFFLRLIISSTSLNFHIKNYEFCDPTFNYPIKIYTAFREVGENYFMDGNATMSIPLDNSLYFTAAGEVFVGQKYINLFNITERRACDTIHKYIGELAYDIERSAQLTPGLCPIRKGRHHVHNVQINFNKLTVQAFPFGIIRANVILSKSRQSDVVCCIKVLIENKAF